MTLGGWALLCSGRKSLKKKECLKKKKVYPVKVDDEIKEIFVEDIVWLLCNELSKIWLQQYKLKDEWINIKKLWLSVSEDEFSHS